MRPLSSFYIPCGEDFISISGSSPRFQLRWRIRLRLSSESEKNPPRLVLCTNESTNVLEFSKIIWQNCYYLNQLICIGFYSQTANCIFLFEQSPRSIVSFATRFRLRSTSPSLSLLQLFCNQQASIKLLHVRYWSEFILENDHLPARFVNYDPLECIPLFVQAVLSRANTYHMTCALHLYNTKPTNHFRSLAINHAYLFFLFSFFASVRMRSIDFLLFLIVVDASVSSPNTAWFYSEQHSG